MSVLCEGNKPGTLVQQTVTNGSPCNYHESATLGLPFMLLYEMTRSPKPLGELGLIEQIRRGFSTSNKAITLGIGDDCAILRPPAGCEVLVTTDFTLEGRHFRRDLHPPESVGHRCLARGLSDLAAMGATPLAAFLSLAMPGTMLAESAGRNWIARFFTGLRALS
ncbi:MAG: thiamine-monophosphate kinase, partial [Acidobacteriaceae bacterium]|nr:thiamine-monophosphate kinase [Acidobacteriaceae bacterium]